MRSRALRTVATTLLAATAACGIGVVGGALSGDRGGSAAAGGGEGGTSAAGGGNDATVGPVAPGPTVRCEDVCDAGTCEAGACVIACVGGACLHRVVCPPGVPCEVRCTGASACSEGVDCSRAAACKVDCNGASACANQPLHCSGSSCAVTCNGAAACASGVDCDAGTCDVTCAGASACANGRVTCSAARCSVQCGVATNDGNSCSSGVGCVATDRCAVTCLAENSCANGPMDLRAGSSAELDCLGAGTCRGGRSLSSADATVHCSGYQSCVNLPTFCDGGRCDYSCTGTGGSPYNAKFCCASPTQCTSRENNVCTVDSTGCP